MNLRKTKKGFERVEFKDTNGERCSIQQSSAPNHRDAAAKPGATFLWLGCDQAREHPVTEEPMAPRMHLNRQAVAEVIAHLQAWLDTGSLKLPTAG